MKRGIILFFIIVFFGTVSYIFYLQRQNTENRSALSGEKDHVIVNGKKIFVEMADTQAERERGLSGRKSLCSGCGMLFIFGEKKQPVFWMKDMDFDLDIVWIDGSKIIQIDRNVSHSGGTSELRRPDFPADKVLEINAGESDEFGVKTGEEVVF